MSKFPLVTVLLKPPSVCARLVEWDVAYDAVDFFPRNWDLALCPVLHVRPWTFKFQHVQDQFFNRV